MQDIINEITKILPFILIGLGLLVLLIIFLAWFIKKVKKLHVNNVYMVTGTLGARKSALSLFIALRKYFSNVIGWFISRVILTELYLLTFRKIDSLKEKLHLKKPMFYTNMYIKYIRFNKFTKEILFREVRIPNKSVVFLDEASLLADSMNCHNRRINADLLSFYKTFRHYSHGGTIVLNTQQMSDNHFSLKRCISQYLFIVKAIRLPFVTLLKVTERVYNDDGNVINIISKDLDHNDLMTVILPNFIFKIYDTYYLSAFTDGLVYYVDYKNPIRKIRDSIKCDELVTVNDFSTLDRRGFTYEKED